MSYKKRGMVGPIVCLVTFFMFCSAIAYAQSDILVSREKLDEWFVNMISVSTVVAAISGVIFGVARLSKIRYVPKTLHINGFASKSLRNGIAGCVGLSAVLLLIAAWQVPFGDVSLSLAEAFMQVLLSLRTLVIVLATMLSFTIFTLVGTRFAPGSRCPYLGKYFLKTYLLRRDHM